MKQQKNPQNMYNIPSQTPLNWHQLESVHSEASRIENTTDPFKKAGHKQHSYKDDQGGPMKSFYQINSKEQ